MQHLLGNPFRLVSGAGWIKVQLLRFVAKATVEPYAQHRFAQNQVGHGHATGLAQRRFLKFVPIAVLLRSIRASRRAFSRSMALRLV